MTRPENETDIAKILQRLDALLELAERALPPVPAAFDPESADVFLWRGIEGIKPIAGADYVKLDLLKTIDGNRDSLLENTRRFANGFAANNALLWGARGMGKSSLVKAVHRRVRRQNRSLKLIEIHRENINDLPTLLDILRGHPQRFVLFCDDLSFDKNETDYKSLKTALDGGVEGRAENCVLYATSNRRHLMPRDMIENESASAIAPKEAVEEKVSLSDRFGLWLGFHPCTQEEYLEMVESYLAHYDWAPKLEQVRNDALEWSISRGARSGRVAFQFITDLAGRSGQKV